MDIVYTIKHDPENNSEELRYSLRSLKNIPHDKVIIVGEKPDWVTNVTYIPVPQNLTKHQNVRNNFIAAVTSDEVSEDFILMNDDFFFMKPVPEMPNLHFGPMDEVIRQYEARYPEGTQYIDTMKALYRVLREKGIEHPISYELHVPMVISKQKARHLYLEVKERLYQFRTYYGNYFNIGGTQTPDVKVFVDPAHNAPEYNENPLAYLEMQTFLSATGGSFKRELVGEFVKSKFPEKSEYEL